MRKPLASGNAHSVGNSEVRDDRVCGLEHDVLGLDVGVHDTARMRVAQRVRDLAGDTDGFINRLLLVSRQTIAQRLAFDQWPGVARASGIWSIEREGMGGAWISAYGSPPETVRSLISADCDGDAEAKRGGESRSFQGVFPCWGRRTVRNCRVRSIS